jgi:glutamate racemase
MIKECGPIGVFDSGYGGLTILSEFLKELPEYDYIYLGDNARSPYGPRSFETVYNYTLQAVKKLFEMGCHLIIIACNTASAKALRSIQQINLPAIDPNRRVLGVIRPSAESVGAYSKSGSIGILGTTGTILSNSYPLEIAKLFPEITVFQHDCPMWVPLVENNEHQSPGADYFIKKDINTLLKKNKNIDTIILGCTHYPLLMNKIRQYVPKHINIVPQGSIVAKSLKDYLKRHPEMDKKCTKAGSRNFYTTESSGVFMERAPLFCKAAENVEQIELI